MEIYRWGEGVEFFSYPQSGCTLFTGYTHLGDIKGEIPLDEGVGGGFGVISGWPKKKVPKCFSEYLKKLATDSQAVF